MTLLIIILKAAGLTNPEVQQMQEHLAGTAQEDFFDTPMYDKLYEYFAFTTGQMPYEAAKARTETPDEWILEHLATLEA